MERMSGVAERLRGMQLDEEEAQRLQLSRKAEERRRRRGNTPPPGSQKPIARIATTNVENCAKGPEGYIGTNKQNQASSSPSSPSRQRKLPKPLDLDQQDQSQNDANVPTPPPKEADLPPPPPPEEVLKEGPPSAEVKGSAVSFAPPAQLPSPLAGTKPVLSEDLQTKLKRGTAEEAFHGSDFANLELKSGPDSNRTGPPNSGRYSN
eukprot:TRINITY_DN30403_c0_g1_i1.p1 TRINITY_DN30403_c0_g1~~TRINITY_DN30403_c0_g1_i1.p1  ORF type:complete len:207 (+),score=55.74 TRINITY_DN30403_c0_g1_i1:419-1039(+)